MSWHAWECKSFRASTVETGIQALQLALSNGKSLEEACRFVGYVVESTRQRALGGKWLGVGTAFVDDPVEILWKVAERGKHRYARGKNRYNYESVGRRILCERLRASSSLFAPYLSLYTAFYDGDYSAAEALHDVLEEKGHLELAKLLVPAIVENLLK